MVVLFCRGIAVTVSPFSRLTERKCSATNTRAVRLSKRHTKPIAPVISATTVTAWTVSTGAWTSARTKANATKTKKASPLASASATLSGLDARISPSLSTTSVALPDWLLFWSFSYLLSGWFASGHRDGRYDSDLFYYELVYRFLPTCREYNTLREEEQKTTFAIIIPKIKSQR